MLNAISTYYDAGYKAGIAMNRRDQALCSNLQDWATRAIALERKGQPQADARNAFQNGYRDARAGTFRNAMD